MSIDNEAAYGLVLQREISLFRDSRDGVDIEIGMTVKEHATIYSFCVLCLHLH